MLSLSIGDIRLPKWLKENKTLRNGLIMCAGLLCADLLLYALLILPVTGRLHACESKFAELRKKRTEAVLFQKQKQDLTLISTGIPSQKDMPLLVKELVQNARRLNLSVSSINYDIPKRSGEELAMLSFSFPAEGKYADIKRFIYDVETSDRLVGIKDLKLNSDKSRVKLEMKLITYIKGQ